MARLFEVTLNLKIDVASRGERDANEATIDGWMSGQPAGSWKRLVSDQNESGEEYFRQRVTLYIPCVSRSEMNTKLTQLDNNIGSLAGSPLVKYVPTEQDEGF